MRASGVGLTEQDDDAPSPALVKGRARAQPCATRAIPRQARGLAATAFPEAWRRSSRRLAAAGEHC